ncbi:MAG: hypothetical protein AAF378_18055 [Cyanobacteria bacterium P01_A01_bin.84]
MKNTTKVKMKKNRIRYFSALLSTITCSFLFISLEDVNAEAQLRCDERIYNWVDRYYIETRSDTQNRVEKMCQSSKNLIQLKCLRDRYKYYDSRYIEIPSRIADRAISYCIKEALNSQDVNAEAQLRCDERIYNWVDRYYIETRSGTQNRVEKICNSSKKLIQLKCLRDRYKYYDSRYIDIPSRIADKAISYCTQEALNSSQSSQFSQDKLIRCVIKVVNKGLSERTALRICKTKVCNSDSTRINR